MDTDDAWAQYTGIQIYAVTSLFKGNAVMEFFSFFFFFQAEDGIRDLVRSRGLGDVYKRQDYWGI